MVFTPRVPLHLRHFLLISIRHFRYGDRDFYFVFNVGQLNAVKGKRCLHHGSPFASVIQFNVLNVNQALLLLSSLNKAGLVERSSGQTVPAP